MGPKVFLLCSQESAILPTLNQMNAFYSIKPYYHITLRTNICTYLITPIPAHP